MQEKISVIVPVYKVEKCLTQCIESIIHQTHTNLEIILVDDGSPDRCGEICDRYAEKDSRIRVIHKENGGLSAARNAGMRVATGDYIGFVDSDDWIEPQMYETLLALIQESGADLAMCEILQIRGDKQQRRIRERDQIYSKEAAMRVLLMDVIGNYVWNRLYPARLIKGMYFPEGRIFEDILWSYRVFEKINSAAYCSKPFYHYVRRQDSIVGNFVLAERVQHMRAYLEQAADMIQRYPENFPLLCRVNYRRIKMLKTVCLQQSSMQEVWKQRKYLHMISRYWFRWRKGYQKHCGLSDRDMICTWLLFRMPVLYYWLYQQKHAKRKELK